MPQLGPPGCKHSLGKLLTCPASDSGVAGAGGGAVGPLPATGSQKIYLNPDHSPTTDPSLLTQN